jgi:flagellar biosynthetic protein FliQ
MELAMKVGGPLMLVGLAIGLIVSVFQAVTQIQEQSLSFIPKIIGVAAVIVIAGPWMLGQLLGYTEELYRSIPSLVGG